MGITVKKLEPHWAYLLAVEEDLVRLTRFVDLDQRNFGCFSIELGRLLMAAGAETDVVCKQLCVKQDPSSMASGISAYRSELLKHFPRLPSFVVTVPRHGLLLKPWSNWNRKRATHNPPQWWTAYNKMKHHRHTHFHEGNLKHALNAVAGLFVVTLYLYADKAEEGRLVPNPILLRVADENFGGTTFDDTEMGINYVLR